MAKRLHDVAVQRGLLLKEARGNARASEQHTQGVSLGWIRQLVALVDEELLLSDTRGFVGAVVVPLTKAKKCR